MQKRRTTGQQGEQLAVTFLQRKGYGIIATNWRCPYGELDLVAQDGPVLVFVEVRTRRSGMQGLAEESITADKQRRLIQLAYAYMQNLEATAQPWLGPWRIDVVAVQVAADQHVRIRHLQHAVEDIQ